MAQVDIVSTSEKKYNYTVTSDSAWAYKSTDSTEDDDRTGYVANGSTLTGYVVTDSNGNEWLYVTSVKSNSTTSGDIKGYYVSLSTLTKGKASTTSTNDDSDEDSDSSSSSDTTYLSEDFAIEYSTYQGTSAYYTDLESGLSIKDIRGVLGIPHQFMSSVDPRITSSDSSDGESGLGRAYSQFIIKRIPLLLMTPGVANFMTSFSNEQKGLMIGGLLGTITSSDLDTLFSGQNGKYYTLNYSYTDYFYYVNAMLRSAAYFLEISKETIDGRELGTLDWMYYSESDGSDIFGHEGLKRFLGPYAGCIAFYADPGNTVDDSFSNSTSQSQLASSLNTLSDTGRELNFLIGNVGSLTGLSLTDETGQASYTDTIDDIKSQITSALGTGNVVSNILGKANTILAGGRIVFPEIWSDSSFSRSYSCSMKLVAGSGSKLSVYLDILVPIYHLLGFTLPRQATTDGGQAYMSPFLVRAFCQGSFNVDMGIISSLNITKGSEGEWTVDGLPTVANVSFDIKDLYEGFFMSKQETIGDTSLISNITELDYIANSCGVNVNDQEVLRTVKMYLALAFNGVISDTIEIGIFGSVAQYFNQKIQNIFGMFN